MKTLKGVIAILSITFAAAVAASAQINLTSIDGTTVNLEGQKGKVVILAVGASWLPLSNKQAEYTNAMAKKYAGRDVVIYFVATDSANTGSKNFASPEAIRKFTTGSRLTVPVLRDPDGSATLRRYKVEQVPSFVVLDKNGKQLDEPIGGIDPTGKFDITILLSRAIDSLL